jgi:hypothetical protein
MPYHELTLPPAYLYESLEHADLFSTIMQQSSKRIYLYTLCEASVSVSYFDQTN